MNQLLDAPMSSWPTTRLGGLPITVAGIEATAQGFVDHVRAVRRGGRGMGRPFVSTSANGEVMARTEHDKALHALFLASDQIMADGMPMVTYSKLRGRRALPERVATTDLVHAVARRAAETATSFYFLGGTEEVNEAAVARMQALHPGLRFAGRHHGFIKQEEAAVVGEIDRLAPDILWVGMGVPLEQEFVARNLDRLGNVAIVKTSGGLFDFLSGKRPRAPRLVQDLGFEWAWRAMLEPARLGPRYLRTNGAALRRLWTASE